MIWTLSFLASTTIVYAVIVLIRRRLKPAFVKLAFASTQTQASRIVTAWEESGTKSYAIGVVLIEMFLLIPLYAWTVGDLALRETESMPVIIAQIIAVLAALLTAVFHFVRNVLLLWRLLAPTPPIVTFLTLVLAWITNTLLALLVLCGIFRAEVYVYDKLGSEGWDYPLVGLVLITVLLGLTVAARQTALSRAHPPLLALQLAPSRLAAKDILERWGERGRKAAERTLLLQCVLAIFYGVTLAVISERLPPPWSDRYQLAKSVVWIILVAAACHLAQNLGAYIALRLRTMGWWVGAMRKLGWTRIALLTLVGFYFLAMLVWFEGEALWNFGTWAFGQT